MHDGKQRALHTEVAIPAPLRVRDDGKRQRFLVAQRLRRRVKEGNGAHASSFDARMVPREALHVEVADWAAREATKLQVRERGSRHVQRPVGERVQGKGRELIAHGPMIRGVGVCHRVKLRDTHPWHPSMWCIARMVCFDGPMLPSIDPGQLVALNALLEEGSVTRAARRLHITQSSMSHRLALLREMLGDPLFVRVGAALVPTARAAAMAEPLAAALRALEQAVAPALPFVPSTSRSRLTMAMPDLLAPLVPGLVGALLAESPGLQLQFTSISETLSAWLAQEPAALALTPTRFVQDDIQSRALGDLQFGVIGRKTHPALRRPLTTARWLAHPHVVVRIRNDQTNVIDEELKRRGLARQVGVEVPSFLAGLLIVAQSNFLMNAPMPLVDEAARSLGLRMRQSPIPLPRVRFAMAWHPRFQDDAAHRWAREQVYEAVRRLF